MRNRLCPIAAASVAALALVFSACEKNPGDSGPSDKPPIPVAISPPLLYTSVVPVDVPTEPSQKFSFVLRKVTNGGSDLFKCPIDMTWEGPGKWSCPSVPGLMTHTEYRLNGVDLSLLKPGSVDYLVSKMFSSPGMEIVRYEPDSLGANVAIVIWK